MADQTRKLPSKCQMHYDSTVQGGRMGFGVDLNPLAAKASTSELLAPLKRWTARSVLASWSSPLPD